MEFNLAHKVGTVVGLIPAAGKASRLGRLPFSKELLPIQFAGNGPSTGHMVVAIEDTIAMLVENDITRQHVVIAPGKWDIPAHLGGGATTASSISYVVAEASPSVPHSLDAAYPFVESLEVVLVFPDIIFRPRQAISALLAHRARVGADVCLALVPSDRGEKVDMVSCDVKGTVENICAKPGAGNKGWTWVAANWAGDFTEFLHRYLQHPEAVEKPDTHQELFFADVLNAAIREGLDIRGLEFPDGDAIDIGTADDLKYLWYRDM